MADSSAFGNIAIIPTLALFKGLSAAGLPPVIYLQGTTTPLDGGQGFFAVSLTDKTTSGNDTSIIVDGGGYRWYLVSESTAAQIVAALTVNGTLPGLDPLTAAGAAIAAATTTDLSTATGTAVSITGSSVSISALGTVAAGRLRILTFAGINTLVYNATSLILPGAGNITTAANDVAGFISLGSGNWQCIWYTEASGGTPGTLPISEGGTGKTTSVTAFDALAAQGANITAASTTSLSGATGPFVNITGNTTITAFGTITAGAWRLVKFTGTPLLTYNATSLILPGAANIQAAANDTAMFISLGAGNWICAWYKPQSGAGVITLPISGGGTGQTTAITAADALSPKGADIASASTTDLATATGPVVDITGSVTITAFGTVSAGALRVLRFTGAPLLTYNATSLILPTAGNIQAAAGDVAVFRSLGSGNWYCESFSPANGLPITTVTVAKGGTNATSVVGAYDSIDAKGADIASASTTDLSTATGFYVNVTGTVTITALGTAAAGTTRLVRFTGALTLTYNATSLILPGAASIVTVAGDVVEFESLGSGNWRCINYFRNSGLAVISKPPTVQTFTSSGTYTTPAGVTAVVVEIVGGGGGGGGAATSGAAQVAAGGGGGGGGYGRLRISAATLGASQTVTVGTGGLAGSAGANAGGTGVTTTFGALLSASGGTGGGAGAAGTAIGIVGGAGGVGTLGNLNVKGGAGGFATGTQALFIVSGVGGCSALGGGATSVSSTSAGVAGGVYGGGGSGGSTGNNGTQTAGGAGGDGVCIVTEFYD